MWVYDDGGRAEAGYKGDTGDCVTRAISIATGMGYQEAYDFVNKHCAAERMGKRQTRRSSARQGVQTRTLRRILADLGWQWNPVMGIGTGCRVHLVPDELPSGTLIVRASKHLTVVIDGLIHDTHNPARGGTRCVYGFWTAPICVSPTERL